MTEEQKADNVVFVGSKSVRAYAEACDVQFNEKKSKEVILKTRGKFMVNAINVAEFLKRKSEGKIVPSVINIGSETFHDKEKNKDIFVSTLEIHLIQK